MEKLKLKELAVPLIKSIDSFNYLLKTHHRRTAVISYYIGKKLNLSAKDMSELVIAAAIHDIGALSVQERDNLIKVDAENTLPHCVMGHRMLSSFEAFNRIAKIIRHHHVNYQDSLKEEGEILFQSYIIHLADRVDILISPEDFILNQKSIVTEKIRKKVPTIFHPEVFEAFLDVSKADIFWIEINNLSMEHLFKKIDFSLDYELSCEKLIEFALTISRIIDFRSRFTASHSYTVAHLSSLIGGYLGYSEEKCKKLLIAGYLHDVGKIGVNPDLIEKDGPLTDEEYNLVKLHVYYTGQILSELHNCSWFSEIVSWAEKHHEKKDGSGYPYSLNDSELEEGARIIAYSDIISALMETRPYRRSLPIDIAFDIIKKKEEMLISTEIYNVIKNKKDEINEMVLKCQAHTFEEYKLGLTDEEDEEDGGDGEHGA